MKIKTYFLLIALPVLYSNLTAVAIAQELPGVRDSLYSETLQEQRFLQIVLPKKYNADSDEKYDVIYLLDGEWHTNLASQIASYVEDNNFMPSSIIVGIINVDRNRDFLPTNMENLPTSGEADQFLTFLKNELLPYVSKKYPVNGTKTLFGASFGGVLSTYALLKEPDLFDSYIASDPSFWWDNNIMSKLAAENLENLTNRNKSFYIGGREGNPYKGMGIDRMDSAFLLKAPAGLHWKFEAYSNETHSSVNLKTMYDGLKFSYSGYNNNVIYHPMNGTIVEGKPIKIWNFTENASLIYTLDGSEPLAGSPKMEQEITLDKPAQLKIKLISHSEKYNKLVTGEFKEGKILPAIPKPKKSKSGGFKYSYYEGEWDSLPDLKKLKLVKNGITDENFKLSTLPKKNNFALLIEGHLEIKDDGYYIFGLESGNGSKLYLGNQLLIKYENLRDGDAQTYIVPLEKGFYPIKFEYFQKEETGRLNLFYVTPGSTDPVPIPLEIQYSQL